MNLESKFRGTPQRLIHLRDIDFKISGSIIFGKIPWTTFYSIWKRKEKFYDIHDTSSPSQHLLTTWFYFLMSKSEPYGDMIDSWTRRVESTWVIKLTSPLFLLLSLTVGVSLWVYFIILLARDTKIFRRTNIWIDISPTWSPDLLNQLVTCNSCRQGRIGTF